jgi:AraC family transcriptional regulator, exoenzyme S synthesis regulatory protein ExsA
MKINAFHLPDYLNGGKKTEMYIHHYSTDKSSTKNKIILHQNLICILLNGTKEVFGAHRPIKINNSEILFMSSGSAIMWESVAENHKLESILIFFSNQLLKEFCMKHNLDFSKQAEKAETVLNLKKDEFLFTFENSLKLLEEKGFSPMQKIKLEELLIYLALKNRSGAFYSFIRNALGSTNEHELRQVIAANADKGLSIDELAFLCNMSVSTFKRHFAKAFNCSPKKFLTTKKMEKARELLLLDQRPSDIYLDLRYQSLSAFSTEFKKHFGISPKQFQSKNTVAGYAY